MPNWCDNYLAVEGTEENLERFLRRVKGRNGALDFNRVAPYPKEYKIKDREAKRWERIYRRASKEKKEQMAREQNGFMKDGYNSGGYDWCITNWGTKWNASDPALDPIRRDTQPKDTRKPYTTGIAFMTAWSPPVPVVHRLSEMFPDLRFSLSFQEEGNCFKGEIQMEDGEVLYEVVEDYCPKDYDEE